MTMGLLARGAPERCGQFAASELGNFCRAQACKNRLIRRAHCHRGDGSGTIVSPPRFGQALARAPLRAMLLSMKANRPARPGTCVAVRAAQRWRGSLAPPTRADDTRVQNLDHPSRTASDATRWGGPKETGAP